MGGRKTPKGIVMRKITIIQRDYDGNGTDRTSVLWVKSAEAEGFLRRKERAYNLDHTEFIVD